MRPVRRNKSPIAEDFNKYEDAKPELVSRLGKYCSYCERRINTLLAVEHIIPKGGPHGNPQLANRWNNFLLACTNCNSCKGSDKVNFRRVLFPDRDNTFYAYQYEDDGAIKLNPHLSPRQKVMARNTLRLVGLDRKQQVYKDSNDEVVSLDRASQRMDSIAKAQTALALLQSAPTNNLLKQSIAMMAESEGAFSIWMKVFHNHSDMKTLFIDTFSGTKESGCFDLQSGSEISPSPNLDQLHHGGKA